MKISLIEQLAQVSSISQWYADNLQCFIGRALQLHMIYDNSYKSGSLDFNISNECWDTPKISEASFCKIQVYDTQHHIRPEILG